jgi:hypothetical protein
MTGKREESSQHGCVGKITHIHQIVSFSAVNEFLKPSTLNDRSEEDYVIKEILVC